MKVFQLALPAHVLNLNFHEQTWQNYVQALECIWRLDFSHKRLDRILDYLYFDLFLV